MLSPADELWGDKGLVVSVKDEVLAYLEDIYRYVKRATVFELADSVQLIEELSAAEKMLQNGRTSFRQSDIQNLIAWLRSNGVTSKTPLHTLRKPGQCALWVGGCERDAA